jgi:pyrroline-5-carboxylate reductase
MFLKWEGKVNKLQEQKFFIIGAGNIGKVLVTRLHAVGVPADQLYITDSDLKGAQETAQSIAQAVEFSDPAINQADFIILATPPKTIIELLRSLKDKLRPGQIIISMAAAVPLNRLRSAVRADTAVVRILPNPPSMFGVGMNPVAFEPSAPVEVRVPVEALLDALGKTVVVEDSQMTWCVGLAGAAMRSVLPVLQGMAQAGVEAGLSPRDARMVAAQIMKGTAALALETELTFEQIKALTPMDTLDENMVANLFLETARSVMQKVEATQAKLMES